MGIKSVSDAEDKELDMQLRKLATAMLVMGMTAGLAHAEDAAPAAGSTLDKIAKNGVIVVGHRESSVPFSYYDNQQKVVGYSQDYSNAIVDAIKKQLNKPDLQVKLVPVTSQNRIPLLQNGTMTSSAAPRPITLNVRNKPPSPIPFSSWVPACW
jgi:glutamate/aspartate transport system substrate-binding protein